MQISKSSNHFDILVIGAGISGIGAAHYIRTELPDKRFAILEGRGTYGGTWDLYKYPGVRSDSDLHTFGYAFKPWISKDSIADAETILSYLGEAISEDSLQDVIFYHHKVISADWSEKDAVWTLLIERTDSGVTATFTAKWVFFGSGYYDYETAHTPHFVGRESFSGRVVHPQFWPENLDYSGKKVVVIGSGATAVTLVPSLLNSVQPAEHVTMLQRTPSYVMPVPKQDRLSTALHYTLGHERGHLWSRRRFVWQQRIIYAFTQRYPRVSRSIIRRLNVQQLPAGYPVDIHFNPPYNPWDQRLCAVPDGDLFQVIRRGDASVVTDEIVDFDETGVNLSSGEHIEADIIVTATGFKLKLFGGVFLSKDGDPIDLSKTVVHRGTMLSGVPNVALAIGYVFSSWTLKIEPLLKYFTAVVRSLDEHGLDVAVPVADPAMPTRPALDFQAGYVRRSVHELPRQGAAKEWRMPTTYWGDDEVLTARPRPYNSATFSMYKAGSNPQEPTQGADREPVGAVESSSRTVRAELDSDDRVAR